MTDYWSEFQIQKQKNEKLKRILDEVLMFAEGISMNHSDAVGIQERIKDFYDDVSAV
jgi:hypothetical protein